MKLQVLQREENLMMENTIYYHKMDSLYLNTPDNKLAEFYRTRDTRILDIISKNKGKRLIFILRADHRSSAVKAFQERFYKDPSMRLLVVQ